MCAGTWECAPLWVGGSQLTTLLPPPAGGGAEPALARLQPLGKTLGLLASSLLFLLPAVFTAFSSFLGFTASQ